MTLDTDTLTARIGPLVAAIGGLGLASSALVDTSKVWPGGGVSGVGYHCIEDTMRLFLPELPPRGSKTGLMSSILPTLHANWINGMPASDQRDIARTLIKMMLSPGNAAAMAEVAHVIPADLESALQEQANPAPALTDAQKDALGRFDLALGSMLDAAYQGASQRYRNVSKVASGAVAVVMALVGGLILTDGQPSFAQFFASLFCGLLAVPLAPMSKDVASALSAAAGAVQAARKAL